MPCAPGLRLLSISRSYTVTDIRARSKLLVDGPNRAGARSMMRAVGYKDEDFRRPLVGVAHSWIEIMPCNFNHRQLAEWVKEGIREAGGTPVEFNTIAVSDGIAMGTEGMKAPLISRGVVADSLELVTRGPLLDALVCISGCDKTIPGTVMALARMDIPGLMVYGGSIMPGRFQGKDVTIGDVYEAIGRHAVGKMNDKELDELEKVACPGAGACGGQFTANTMATAFEALGISPAGSSRVPATDQRRKQLMKSAGRRVLALLKEDVRPRQIITRPALENAIRAVMATGGSTNAVLHLLAVAREAGVPLTLDDFDKISSRTPLLADMKPWGKYTAVDMDKAGGILLVLKRLLEAKILDGNAMTVSGKTIGEEAAATKATPGRWSARGWATRSRSSPMGASQARPMATWSATSRPRPLSAVRSPACATAIRSSSTPRIASSTSRSTRSSSASASRSPKRPARPTRRARSPSTRSSCRARRRAPSPVSRKKKEHPVSRVLPLSYATCGATCRSASRRAAASDRRGRSRCALAGSCRP